MLMMLVLRLAKFRQSLGRAAALAVFQGGEIEIQLMLMMLALRITKSAGLNCCACCGLQGERCC